ncbi:MAG: nucleoside monophosphate kinase, partial [Armatimonadetes bacterium]|nr:nucleoside monophosphate kinase [Armatimonadota bacterium]
MANRQVVVLLGPPGAGKGTQGAAVVDEFGLVHVATGDLLRAAVAEGTQLGLEARKYMDAGQLVPDDVVIGIVREKLSEPEVRERGVLL